MFVIESIKKRAEVLADGRIPSDDYGEVVACKQVRNQQSKAKTHIICSGLPLGRGVRRRCWGAGMKGIVEREVEHEEEGGRGQGGRRTGIRREGEKEGVRKRDGERERKTDTGD